ncbi:hypothetical protein SAICODRAFT_10190 [Saitoella complicata NRRL Y-17804]|uniref:Roadblock/LAMTOR2 domain-containing protein n=1 Tax=Saitoella complicata (strain BCRC 22490 / CBS 7301 / JCM 7358 / NBRC 10748 / NRRL Y-17804) TaxID=698492 RepID=A0A0E9NKI9_SAICN|nr:uncharacterized protein SAICODRAFT_10190 [Saitoella complicata NRRL Y-17804]ODQ50135.1 hypothetical protein SAICODRAFT_10190 [Saitoella complicata NRRL Y-17804]GAO49910.1 hypothetical protein G7K_4046-t1 [Saitoella complicata NRRL Y-17804]
MLKPKRLQALLEQSLSTTVSSALLFTASGSLLAYASKPKPTTAAAAKEARTQAALASAIWQDYDVLGRSGVVGEVLGEQESGSRPGSGSSGGSESNGIAGRWRSVGADEHGAGTRWVCVEAEMGTLMIVKVDVDSERNAVHEQLLVCLIGGKGAEEGILKAKADGLGRYLAEALVEPETNGP